MEEINTRIEVKEGRKEETKYQTMKVKGSFENKSCFDL